MTNNKAVARWLLVGAVMIIIQVLLGGLTRLTDSGLSITEWKPLLGTIPPLNDSQWQEAFNKYKEIAQFKKVHNYFTMSDFKFIFYWEWFHRVWARLLGVVFLIPFVYFLYKKWINRSMFWPMVVLFLLGGLQGFIGWVMVKSGVGTSLIFVDPVKLAIHFIAALVLLVYVIWFALKLLIKEEERASNLSLYNLNFWVIGVLGLQLIYGAFMAGARAGYAAITWPKINGFWLPPNMFSNASLWSDLTENLITIQFIHRLLAYILLIIIVVFWNRIKNISGGSYFQKVKNWPLYLVILQVFVGVVTVLNYVGDHRLLLSIIHQFVGMLLLVSLVLTLYAFKPSEKK